MIDIIIPVYNSHDTLVQTLLSIAGQTIKDQVTVYLIDDCSKKDYKKEIALFKNKLNIIELKLNVNRGPGVARQYGIDNSKSEYLFFLDSDDLLVDCFSLRNIYNAINDNNADVAVGVVLDEINQGYFRFLGNPGNLHGKIYRREFINKHNICFNDSRSSEDNSFNRLVLLYHPKIVSCPNDITLYRDNKNSITQSDNQYIFTGIKPYVENMIWAIEIGEKNKCSERLIADLVFSSAFYVYKVFHICINPGNVNTHYPADYFTPLIKYIRDNPNQIDVNKILAWFKPLAKYVKKYDKVLTEEEKWLLYSDYMQQVLVTVSFEEFLEKSSI